MLKLDIAKMRALARERGGRCISTCYVNSAAPLLWECTSGHLWSAVPASIRKGTWCPDCARVRRLTLEQMIEIAKSRGGRCLSNRYRNAATKLEWCCSTGHKWSATPLQVKKGHWCPFCARVSLVERSDRWYGVYRVDVLEANGTFKREQCWQHLGLVSEQSKRAAWRQFQPFLDRVNDAAKKLPPRVGLTLAEFTKEWRRDVTVNLKGSTARAAESHLRAHITPKLGSLRLSEITTKTVQGFVAYLAGGGRSRRTVENVLLSLSSLLKTARAWGYACGDFRFADLTLPREGVKAEPRSFTDQEMQRIIAHAPEPLSTIIAVTAVLGLRIGETLALRRSDVDFAKRIIRIRHLRRFDQCGLRMLVALLRQRCTLHSVAGIFLFAAQPTVAHGLLDRR